MIIYMYTKCILDEYSICHCISSNIGRVHISPIIISSSVINTLYIALI